MIDIPNITFFKEEEQSEINSLLEAYYNKNMSEELDMLGDCEIGWVGGHPVIGDQSGSFAGVDENGFLVDLFVSIEISTNQKY